MEQEKKPNRFNSNILQAILDLRRAMDDCNIYLTDISDIIDELQGENSELRARADAINHRHQYPEKSITFLQTATYDQCPERFELERPELALLELMERIQSTDGYVTVIKNRFVDVLHYTDTERKNLQGYLDHLTQLGFLQCIYRPPKGSKKPGEYKINSTISWVGRQGKKDKPVVLQGFNSKYTKINTQIVLPNGGKVSSGTLDEKKKRASADIADPQSKPYTGSESQSNINRHEQKNQDTTVNLNMTNKGRLFTPEEDALFGQMSFNDIPGVMPEGV